jgi:general secretion pathway protein B
MSILLDALKKSETQRTLGETPGIHTAVDAPIAAEATGQQWIPLSMLALSAVAIAWFGWQQFIEPPMPAVSTPAASSQGGALPATEESQQLAVAAGKPAQKRTPVEARQENGGSAKDVATAPAPGAQESETRKQNLNQSFANYEAKGEPESSEAKSSEARQPRPPSITKNRRTVASAGTSPGQKSTPPSTVKTQPKRPSRMEPVTPEPISFWQVPQTLRDGLPEIRITVLVYAQAAEDRFVLINGQRLVEKEELAPGVVLDEIRRDGAVFSYRKYRFLVKG